MTTPMTTSPPAQTGLLSEAERRTLAALLDRLIPPGDGWPGGAEGGALAYLLDQFGRDLASQLPAYRAALKALDAEAQAWDTSSRFADLPPDTQVALLTRVEKGEVAAAASWEEVDPVIWFRAATEHAAEGFYTAPVGLEMVGFQTSVEKGAPK